MHVGKTDSKHLNKWIHLYHVMTNITLSIEDSVYKRMRKHSEIRWSEYVRRMIKEFLDEIESRRRRPSKESVMIMMASEDILRTEWGNDADERWNNV